MKGLVIISLPKSGTMFLSSYLGEVTGYRSIFGLKCDDSKSMTEQLPQEPDPLIGQHLSQSSPAPDKMVKKYLQMVNRGRDKLAPESLQQNTIVTDHGFDNFPLFLRNPDMTKLIEPTKVVEMANAHDMGVLYLYRRLEDVVLSMSNFVVSRKSYLINIDSVKGAFEVAVNCYAEKLAEHVRLWKKKFRKGLMMTYERLKQDTQNAIFQICDTYQLPVRTSEIISSMEQYKAWTYRKSGKSGAGNKLPAAYIRMLNERYPDLI